MVVEGACVCLCRGMRLLRVTPVGREVLLALTDVTRGRVHYADMVARTAPCPCRAAAYAFFFFVRTHNKTSMIHVAPGCEGCHDAHVAAAVARGCPVLDPSPSTVSPLHVLSLASDKVRQRPLIG